MSSAQVLFKALDILFDLPQNPRKLEKELADVVCEKDIPYSAEHPDYTLDLYYLPESKTRHVIFEIHGGGFSAGDKTHRRCLCAYYAKMTGAAVVNVNYGVGEQNACPVPMQQLAAAVNWVVQNAPERNWDLSRFVATGDSAGAYYACFLSTLQDSPYLQELFQCKIDAKFTATMFNCGVFDFKYAMEQKSPLVKGICQELMGMTVEEAVQSPYFEGLTLIPHITEKFPETFLVYSEKDLFVKGQGETLAARLEQLGVPYHVVAATSVADNHTYSLVWSTKMAKETNAKIIAYLNDHFTTVNI